MTITKNINGLLLFLRLTHSLTAALDQLRVIASSTSNDPGPRARQHQQIGQRLLPLAAANVFATAFKIHEYGSFTPLIGHRHTSELFIK